MVETVNKDLANSIVTSCQTWSTQHGANQVTLESCPDPSKANIISSYGLAMCTAISEGHLPPGTPIDNAVWLGKVAEQERVEATQCSKAATSIVPTTK